MLYYLHSFDPGLSKSSRVFASLKQGRAYSDGTVIVFDLLDIRSAQDAIETRSRKFVAVMKKNGKLNASTGGWGWEVFRGDEQKASLQDPKPCFDCLGPQKQVDYRP